MIRHNTDAYAVLKYMKTMGNINERQAIMHLGVKRLSARINDLKNEGYSIRTVLKKVLKNSGRWTNVTDKYVLNQEVM